MWTMLCGQLGFDKSSAKTHLYYNNLISDTTDCTFMDYAQRYSAQGVRRASLRRILMKLSQCTTPLWVMPCLESHFHVLANAEHVKQNCQLFNMNGRMYAVTWGVDRGPTKPRADRGYHFDMSVWACRVAQGALDNLPETPPLHSQTPSFFFRLPSSPQPLRTLYVPLPLRHPLPMDVYKQTHTNVQYTHMSIRTVAWKQASFVH